MSTCMAAARHITSSDGQGGFGLQHLQDAICKLTNVCSGTMDMEDHGSRAAAVHKAGQTQLRLCNNHHTLTNQP